MSAIDDAYGHKLAYETPAWAVRDVPPAFPPPAGVAHHCYLCGTHWQAPALSWVAHNRECEGLQSKR